jgi:hypothetical protein
MNNTARIAKLFMRTTPCYSGFEFAYNTRMSKASDHEAECTEVLRRMLNAKPLSKAEISARIKAERAAKKTASVQKMDRPKTHRP